MKKFLTFFAAIFLFANFAQAQNQAPSASTTDQNSFSPRNQRMQQRREVMNERYKNQNQQNVADAKKPEMASSFEDKLVNSDGKKFSSEEREKMKQMHEEKKQAREERYKNASPEEKARMDRHHEMMEKLSPQQREEAKKEMDRHRAEMRRITGFELRDW